MSEARELVRKLETSLEDLAAQISHGPTSVKVSDEIYQTITGLYETISDIEERIAEED